MNNSCPKKDGFCNRHFKNSSANYHGGYHERGFSAWTILPWLLFLTLAFVFWWFVNERTDSAVQPTAPAQAVVAPAPATTEVVAPRPSVEPVLSYHEAVKKAAVSVVNIYTTQKLNHPYADDPLFQEFLRFHGYNLPQNGETNLGSGVIVSNDGYVVTNAHVVDKADEIVVALSDGRKAKARIIGTDKESDLAVIKLELDKLIPIEFKDQAVQVGDVMLAIGNPFGVGQTVTQGIVSATGRTGLGMNTYEDFIQTDAAINPGNSGGALVDAQGRLVGINTMIYSRSGGSMGIGFAIPNTIVKKVMQDLIATGRVSRGWLGIEVGQIQETDTTQKGALVGSVMPNAPAYVAGVQAGDIIVSVDGVPTDTPHALIQTIAQKSPNSPIVLEVIRKQQPLKLTANLGERPSSESNNQSRSPSPAEGRLLLPNN